MNIFSVFFGSVCTEDSIFCFLSSLPSHLENSAELIEFCRFIPSSTRFNVRLVSGVNIDSMSVSYLVSISTWLGSSRLRLCRVVSDSTDFLNLGATT